MHAACEKCGAPLTISGDADWLLLVTEFPADLGGSLMLLAGGPGSVPCSRCSHVSELNAPHLVRGPNLDAVLYLPSGAGIAAADVHHEIMQAVARARGTADELRLVVAHERRAFRRAFLAAFVEPHVRLLNSYQIEASDKVAWFKLHEQKLTGSFFGALFLLASGAIPLYTTLGTEVPATALVPHESAPSAASHVVATHQATQVVAAHTGELLGWLLVVWALRSLELRSMEQVKSAAVELLTSPALTEPVLAATGSVIASCVSGPKTEQRGTIVWDYALEAVLTILCHAHGRRNPRRREWTTIQLIYDYARRLDGNDESILLEPELIRSTIDEPQFWREYEELGREVGLGTITETNMRQLQSLLHTAARVFPNHMTDLMKVELKLDPGFTDDKALAESRSLLRRAFDRLPDTTLLEALLNGLRLNSRQLLVPIANSLLAELDKRVSVSSIVKGKVLRLTIEALNSGSQIVAASNVAERLAELLATEEAKEIPPAEQARLFNEIGNCMRYVGQFERALEIYEKSLDLLGRDPKDSHVRVALRNRAIILRDLHHYSEAQSAFAQLKPYAHDSELRGLVVSEAVCAQEMGMTVQALNLLELHRDLINGRAMNAPHVLEYATLLALHRFHQGLLEEATASAPMIAEAGRRAGNWVAQATAARIDLANAVRIKDPSQRKSALIATIAQLSQILEGVAGKSRIPTVGLGAMQELDQALVAAGRADEAEALIWRLLDGINPSGTPKGWLLYLLVACHSMRRQRRDKALAEVEGALKYLNRGLWEVTANEDVLAIFSPQAESLAQLVRLVFDLNRDKEGDLGELARFAADLRAAPVLTARLRRRVGLENPGEDLAAEEARLVDVLKQTPATVVQFVGVVEDVVVLRTSIDGEGRLRTNSSLLGLAPEALGKIAIRLRSALRSADPTAAELDLNRVRGWEDLAARLRRCLSDAPAEVPLCVVAGAVGEVAVSLALESRALCFVPSLAGLIALRERRRAISPTLNWRPKRLFDFAVWFDRELPAEAAVLSQVVQGGAELARAHGMGYGSAYGRDATGARLLEGLATADVARIACHGRILPHAEAIDILVAANGYLPPADLTEVLEADAHVLSWRHLSDLERAPAAVFSSACDSGLTVVNLGGERLGLERPLFSAGSLTFVAPLWPVPTSAIQEIVALLVDRWLSEPDRPLAVHVAEMRATAVATHFPPLAAQALAVFGDGF